MKIKTFFAISLTLALFTAGHAQALDKANLDQFLDRLAEKNKAMESLTIAKDGTFLPSLRSSSLLPMHESKQRQEALCRKGYHDDINLEKH